MTGRTSSITEILAFNDSAYELNNYQAHHNADDNSNNVVHSNYSLFLYSFKRYCYCYFCRYLYGKVALLVLLNKLYHERK